MEPEFESVAPGIGNFRQSMMNSATGPALSPLLATANSRVKVGSAQRQAGVKSLDIGCGRNKTSGCIGIDRVSLPGVDIVHDLDQFPWPFPNGEFSIIYANHFLEHVSHILETLAEIHRICMPDGSLIVRVPHYASDNFHTDLTHKVAFGYRSFDHFSINGKTAYDFYAPFKFEILRRRIKFMSPLRRFDPFRMLGIETLANLFPRVYERFFVYLLPPAEIQFELRVVK
jgi:SAM-dependent methyltransferase